MRGGGGAERERQGEIDRLGEQKLTTISLAMNAWFLSSGCAYVIMSRMFMPTTMTAMTAAMMIRSQSIAGRSEVGPAAAYTARGRPWTCPPRLARKARTRVVRTL